MTLAQTLQHSIKRWWTEAISPSAEDLPLPAEFSVPISELRLVCQEDILYYDRLRDRMVLLLRAGQQIEPSMLDKLLQYGIRPQQFRFAMPDLSEAALEENLPQAQTPEQAPERIRDQAKTQQKTQTHSPAWHKTYNQTFDTALNTGLDTAAAPHRRSNLKRVAEGNILILESQINWTNRLSQCLGACGVGQHQIHPIFQAKQLAWAMRKYAPRLLFLSLDQLSKISASELKTILQQQAPSLEKLVLIHDDRSGALAADTLVRLQQRLLQQTGKPVVLVKRPISRFELLPLI